MSTTPLRLADIEGRVGQEIAVSPWYVVAQEQIDRFADATEDRQWIHVDRERARSSPFGSTIAHGFLTLSLLPKLAETALAISDRKMGVNYGLDRVRFTAPVPAGSKVRARFTPAKCDRLEGGGLQVTWTVTVERESSDKPCLVAAWLVRYYG
jgi:acyl dehydratase